MLSVTKKVTKNREQYKNRASKGQRYESGDWMIIGLDREE
jgi:hypothetical protein